MKVTCPHCAANYAIDDRRIPASGLNVKCPKCSGTFPVKRDAGATPAEPPAPPPSAAVPLPAPERPFAPPPPRAAEPFTFGQQPGSVPLPAPDSPFAPPPPTPAVEPFTFGQRPGVVALPAPDSPFAPPPPGDAPFAFGDSSSPFAPPGEGNPFATSPGAEEPLSFHDTPATTFAPPVPEPFGGAAAEPAFPPPFSPPAEAPVGFGEIDFEDSAPPPAPAAPPRAPSPAPPPPAVLAPDPFAAAPIRSPPPPSGGGEELEDLFGESKKPSAPPPPSASGETGPLSMDAAYQVRRRSGKVFGPFPPDAIAEMLQKGELQGNEDVSTDGGENWQPMSGVAAFRDAAGKANAPPQMAPAVPGVPFGSRMAPTKLGDGGGVIRTRPAWLKYAIIGLVVVLIVGVGAAGAFTRYGLFFYRAFRSDAERNRVAAIVGKAKAGLARGDFAGEKEALRQAAEALAAAPDDADAQLAFVLAASAMERRHAGSPDAAQRAGKAAADLAADSKGTPQAVAAELAQSMGSADHSNLSQRESALDQLLTKGKPDPEIVALLARSALQRRDGVRAAAQFKRLDALQPGTARGALGAGLSLAAQGKGSEALPFFQSALALDPALPDARIEAAAVLGATGDPEKAKALLAPLLEPAAGPTLAPLDRARALTVSASLLARRAADGPQAEKLLAEAVAADSRYVQARVALAHQRLRRGDAAGAVAATDPAASEAGRNAELADVRIRALVAAGRALDAAQLMEAALAAFPGNPRLLVAKAMVQEQTGKLGEAQATYRDCIARAPGEWEARVALARLAMANRDLALAQTEVTAAVEKSGNAPAPHAALGELRLEQGDTAGAEAAYRKALSLDDEHAPALVGLARIALARGDTDGARAGIDRALEIDPGRFDARRLRGDLLWKAGDLKGAAADFKVATELQARDALGFARLGAVTLELGDVAASVRALENATGLDPNLAEAQYWLGRALLARGELPGALTRLRRAIELAPAVGVHHLWLGIAMERSNSLGEAVESYRAAAAADPKLAEASEREGNIYAAAGRCEDAVPAYQKALAAAPKALKVKIAIGDCRGQKKPEEAIRLYREVLKADPKQVAVLYKMARAIHESTGVKDAIPWYERAVREEPENPMPYYFLGFAYKDRGQKAKAVQLFKQYLVKRPDAEDKKDIAQEIEDLGG